MGSNRIKRLRRTFCQRSGVLYDQPVVAMRMALNQPRLLSGLQTNSGLMDCPNYERIPTQNWLPGSLKNAPSVRTPDGDNGHRSSVRRHSLNFQGVRQSAVTSVLLETSFVLFVLSVFGVSAAGQSSTNSSTENEALPEADFHVQLPSNWRSLSLVGLEQAAGYPFQQWYVASGIGYQFKPILGSHRKNIDPDKEHYLVSGAGYE
jgi:hypothetical protein